jgi:hypothetical protein
METIESERTNARLALEKALGADAPKYKLASYRTLFEGANAELKRLTAMHKSLKEQLRIQECREKETD